MNTARSMEPQATPGHMSSFSDAILEATRSAMRQDERVFVMGEGVTDPKSVFGTTTGLQAEFGSRRVMEMPVAESGWTGIAIGAALMGQRPILVHQRMEFALLAAEQMFNNAAKMHYVSHGRHRVPIVIRLIMGRGWGQGPAHSQCLTAMFASIPGLKVVAPSTAGDAHGLLLAAIADDNPVVMVEHRWLHATRGMVGSLPLCLDAVVPRHVRSGDRVTVVASSYATLEVLQAAAALAEVGCNVDQFDLRIVRPLKLGGIADSVARTGRLVVVEDGHRTLGLGAEIVASIVETVFDDLVVAPVRLGLPDHPTPASASLVEGYYPRAPEIARAIGQVAGFDAPRLDAVCAALVHERDSVPRDVPFAGFSGPF